MVTTFTCCHAFKQLLCFTAVIKLSFDHPVFLAFEHLFQIPNFSLLRCNPSVLVLQIYEELPSVKKGRRDEDYEAARGSAGQPYYASAPPVPGLPAHDATRGEPVTGYPVR